MASGSVNALNNFSGVVLMTLCRETVLVLMTV